MLRIRLRVEYFNNTLTNKEHLFDIGSVSNDLFVVLVNTTEHLDYKLIPKSSLTVLKKVIEVFLEFLKDPSRFNKL